MKIAQKTGKIFLGEKLGGVLNLPRQKTEKCKSKNNQEEQEIVVPSRPTWW